MNYTNNYYPSYLQNNLPQYPIQNNLQQTLPQYPIQNNLQQILPQYPVQYPIQTPYEISSLTCALLICFVIIIAWYVWAMYIYRFSHERLANLALAKHSAKNKNQLFADGSNYFNFDPDSVVFENNILTLDILLKDKATQTEQDRKTVSYKYDPNCYLLNFSCIN